MPRTLTVRKPDHPEVRHLLRCLESDDLTPTQRHRAEVLLMYASGWDAIEIARSLSLHPNTVYTILHAYDRDGLAIITRVGRGGARPRLMSAQRSTIVRIADQPPYELGLPYGRWSLAQLRDYLIRQRVVKAISREHLRRVLKKGGSASAGWNASSAATTRGVPPSWLRSAGSGATSPSTGTCCSSRGHSSERTKLHAKG